MTNLRINLWWSILIVGFLLLIAHDLYATRQLKIEAIDKRLKVQQECFQMQERMTRIAAERKWWLTIPACPEVL